MIKAKTMVMLVAAFVAGSFVASPELRAYAAATVTSADIKDGEVKSADLANNAVTAAKIKDGEVKAAEIAQDAVGASEIQGVSKLLFGQCSLTSIEALLSVPAGSLLVVDCTISGVDSDDTAVATLQLANTCFNVAQAHPMTNNVEIRVGNTCSTAQTVGPAKIAIIVFDK